MGYYYGITVIGLILLVVLAAGYSLRERLVHFTPISLRARFRDYAPLSTFEAALQNGLSTNNFDISTNTSSGDTRSGMDEAALTEVRRLMDINSIGFDEARLLRHNRHLARNGIDEFGFPTDPKAITSLA